MWRDIKFYLDRVSRSFALAVPMLDVGMREAVGIAYIILRLLDSIEDANISKVTRLNLYDIFLLLLSKKSENNYKYYQCFYDQNWDGLSSEEKKLFSADHLPKIIRYFWEQPKFYRYVIRSCVKEMMEGMKKFSFENSEVFTNIVQSKRSLRSENLYNEYCYYVAGTVGILLTKISVFHYKSKLKFRHKLLKKALGFSRVLQKVNIIKDWRKDIDRGYCFLPNNFFYKAKSSSGLKVNLALVLKDINFDFKLAKQYVEFLPKNFAGFKKFCLMALLPAYETIFYINKLNEGNKIIKIPKNKMLKCFLDAQNLSSVSSLLENLDISLHKMVTAGN